MAEALKEAKKAARRREVPIGAVLVKNGRIISRGHNSRQRTQNALKHAEMIAIEKACKKLHSWRLEEVDMYVTLEPCPMCAGAIANARLRRVYYACSETTSNDGLCQAILSSKRLNHCVQCEQGDYAEQASALLSDFFRQKR